MGRAAKLKREFNRAIRGQSNNAKKDDAVKFKIDRVLRRDIGAALHLQVGGSKLTIIPQFKEWPCQMTNGKAILPIDIVPYKKDDGKLYYLDKDSKEKMVVSLKYEVREEQKRLLAQMLFNDKNKTQIAELKDGVQLGE